MPAGKALPPSLPNLLSPFPSRRHGPRHAHCRVGTCFVHCRLWPDAGFHASIGAQGVLTIACVALTDGDAGLHTCWCSIMPSKPARATENPYTHVWVQLKTSYAQMFVCASVCLCVCVSVYLCVCVSVCLSVCMCCVYV